jgi:hypothetical protein
MTAKYRVEYRKQQREKWAAEISAADQEMLEAMRKLRPMTSVCQFSFAPELSSTT